MKRRLPLYDESLRLTSDRICTMPFREMDILPNGDVHCCNWTTAPLGNLQLNTSREVWTSENAQELRRSVVDKTYEYCKGDQCPWLNSPDEQTNNPLVNEEPVLFRSPEIINAAYDRTCNMFCNSCRKYLIADQNDQRHEFLRKRIEEFGHVHELILIGGGDPFASPHTRQWMMDGITLADTITIWTNGILLTPERWKKLPPETRNAIGSIEVSIDAATPDTYHQVRAGGDWDILMDNMSFISELRVSGEIQNLRINFVVRMENYKEMPAFVELGEHFGVDDIYYSRMEDWGSFSCNQMPRFQVHLEDHPDYNDFLRILEEPVLKNPKVRLGNLRGRRQNAAC